MGKFLSLPEGSTIAIAAGAGLLFLFLAVLLSDSFLAGGPLPLLIPLAASIVAVTAVVRPRWIFYGYLSLCMVIPTELEEMSLRVGAIQLYPQDALFAFLTVVAVLRSFGGKVSLHGIRFNRYVALYICLGAVATGLGLLLNGNDFNNVLGDFRRSFFYFLIYVFALVLTANPTEIRFLKYALLAGSSAAIARGLFQAFTGSFVTRRYGDAAHIMNHFEVTFSGFAVYVGLANTFAQPRQMLKWLPVILAGGIVMVLGNFRTCWIGFIGGLGVMTMLLPPLQRRWFGVVSTVLLALTAGLLLYLWDVPVPETHSTIGENIARKASWDSGTADTNVTWRLDSYQNAISLWQMEPLFGRGLGEQLEFYTSTSTGSSMLAVGHRVHNSYLWLLMSLGIVGFGVFIYIHWNFVREVLRPLRRHQMAPYTRATILACLSFYAAIMVSACFDVYLESTSPITILAAVMALSLLTISYNTRQP